MSSRRPLETQHTNPFRQSIIARSESPFEAVQGMTYFANSSAPSLTGSNPFGDLLEPELDLEDCEDEDLLVEEPPAYNDVVEGRPGRQAPPVDEKRDPHARPGAAAGRSEGEGARARGERSSRERERSDRSERERSERSDRERSDRERSDRDRERSDRNRERNRERPHSGSRSEEQIEREHRRLIEREKYYRERRKELERRQNRTPEEQQRDKERRRRRREAKAQEGASSSAAVTRRSRSKSESVVKVDKHGRPLDTIDKMDVTGLFGPGAFHHDGPFDACNPHRNKKTNLRPPVAAFNIEGPNFSLAPGDVNEERARQQTTVFGKYEEPVPGEDPTEAIHGSTTMGLGSSTFMDGTPASKDAIQEARLEGRLGRSASRRQVNPPEGEQKVSLFGRVRSFRRPN